MGGDIEPNEGYFFQFDALWWAVLPPNVTQIGYPNLTREVYYGPTVTPIPNPGSTGANPIFVPPTITQEATQSNTLDTSSIPTQFSIGNRFEFGRVEDCNGWLCSIYQIRDQEQDFTFASANMVFQDEPFGPASMQHLQGPLSATGPSGNLPVTVFNIGMDHSVSTWGVELVYLHRFRTCHEGSTFEVFAGPRYLQFDDTFGITLGTAPALTVPDYLAGTSWTNSAQNHIISGELGARWFKKKDVGC